LGVGLGKRKKKHHRGEQADRSKCIRNVRNHDVHLRGFLFETAHAGE
jgi:hypothetical protein